MRSGIRALALLGATVLAGCEDDPFPKDRCTLASIGDMKVLTTRFSPIIPVTLNGKPVAMEVDTGAQNSTLSSSIVERLDLSQTMTNAVVHGVDGSGFVGAAPIASLGVGEGHISNITLMVMPARMDQEIAGLPLAGLFGGDFLYNYVSYFDLPDRQFSLYREFHCSTDIDLDYGWENGAYTLPFEEGTPDAPHDLTKIRLTIRLDGHELDAVLDSGASGTSVSLDDAHRLGVTDAMLAEDRKVGFSGAMGNRKYGWIHRFASLDIGPEHFTDLPLAVQDTGLPVLLGADFLRTHRVLISYRRHKIYVERRAHPAPPSPTLGGAATAQTGPQGHPQGK